MLPKYLKINHFLFADQILDFMMSGNRFKTNSGIPPLSLHDENASSFYFFISFGRNESGNGSKIYD